MREISKSGVLQATLINILEEGFISLPVLLFKEYKKIGLAEVEVMLLVQLMLFREKEGIAFPTAAQLTERTNLTEDMIVHYIQTLVRRGFIAIEEDINECGMRCERYSLLPLQEQLISAFIDRDNVVPTRVDYDTLFKLFEQEFGRTISPLESEILVRWIDEDKYSKELIEAALREAVFSDKLHFRYIDRILLDWQRKGIKTANEAANYTHQFRQNRRSRLDTKQPPASDKAESSFKFYNWVTKE